MAKRSRASVLKRIREAKQTPSRKLLGQSQADLNSKCNLLAEQFQIFSQTMDTIYRNQKALGESETKLDSQFVVLTRLTIMTLNAIMLHLNKRELEPLQLIGYDDINKMFEEWDQFKARPDWREHTRPWFMGEDLSTLPPPPVEA
jgi:hypothetical protein